MSDNVVTLFGGQVETEPREPVESLVRELERLLEAARAGQIVGFAGAYQHNSATVEYSYAGAVGSYAMLGGLECVRLRLAQRAVQRDLT
ncbi:MAG: hypothetical protein AB7O57_01310 [Hyphomicrobiaceae bacterium]